MRKSSGGVASAASAVMLLAVCAGCGRRSSSGCRPAPTDDRHAPLGTRHRGSEPPERLGGGLVWSMAGRDDRATDASSAIGSRFRIEPGSPMGPGDSIWARWTAAPGTLAGAPVDGLAGRVGPPPRPRAGNGTDDGGDRSSRRSLHRPRPSPSGTGSRARPRSRLRSSPAQSVRDPIHLPRPVCDQRGSTRSTRTVLSRSVRRRRLLAAGRRAHRARRRTPDLVARHALRPQRRRRRRRPRPARSSRSTAPTRCRCRWAIRRGRVATSAPTRAPRVRRRPAVPAAHRQRLAGHRHQQAAAGPARRAGAARGRGGQSDADLRAGHADHHLERCDRAGVGSRSARCGQRRWGQRPRAAHGALGPAGEPDACS